MAAAFQSSAFQNDAFQTGVAANNATLGVTLGAVTPSATATVLLQGAASVVLGAAVASAVATDPVSGLASISLGAATLAGTATDPVAAQAANTLGAATLAATATDPVSGAVSQTLGAATLSAVATDPVSAAASNTLGAASLDASATTGAVSFASADIALGAVQVGASATAPLSAAATIDLGAAWLGATATDPVQASAGIALGAATASAFAGAPRTASAAIALGEAAVQSAATVVTVAPPSPVEPYIAARPDSWVEPQRVMRRGVTVMAARRVAAHATTALRSSALQYDAARVAGGDVVACRFVSDAFNALRGKRPTGPKTPPTPPPARVARVGISLDAAALSATLETAAGAAPAQAVVDVSLLGATAEGQAAVYSALDASLAQTLGAAGVDARAVAGALPAQRNASLNWTLDPAGLAATATSPDDATASASLAMGAASLGATGKVRQQASVNVPLGSVSVVGVMRRPVSAVLSASLGAVRAAATASAGGRLRGATVLNAKAYGALGDGIHDDTLAIQAAIDALPTDGGTVVVPDGTYLINTDRLTGGGGLKLRSKMLLQLQGKLKAMDNNSARDYILLVKDVSDVEIAGTGRTVDHLQGDLATATGLYAWPAPTGQTTSEWGHGIAIYNSDRVTVRDLRVRECVGDGISIGSGTPQDVRIERVDSLYNRRQGLSVVACDGLLVEDCTFGWTKGTSPECGIDVEPETSPVKNLTFRRVRSVGNQKYGILLLRRTLDNGAITNVLIEDCISETNVSLGVQVKGADNVVFRRNTVRNNGSEGCWVDGGSGFLGEDNTFQNNYTKNGNNAARNFDLIGTDSRTATDWILRNFPVTSTIGLNHYR